MTPENHVCASVPLRLGAQGAEALKSAHSMRCHCHCHLELPHALDPMKEHNFDVSSS